MTFSVVYFYMYKLTKNKTKQNKTNKQTNKQTDRQTNKQTTQKQNKKKKTSLYYVDQWLLFRHCSDIPTHEEKCCCEKTEV